MPSSFIARLAEYDARAKTEPLHARLHSAAFGIAAMLDAGELDGSPLDTRIQLRALSMELLAMSDEAQALRDAARPLTAREREARPPCPAASSNPLPRLRLVPAGGAA